MHFWLLKQEFFVLSKYNTFSYNRQNLVNAITDIQYVSELALCFYVNLKWIANVFPEIFNFNITKQTRLNAKNF